MEPKISSVVFGIEQNVQVHVSGSRIESVNHVILFFLCKIPNKVAFIAK